MQNKMDGLKMNKIEIIQGDAIDLLKKIESDSIDLIIADPPYNLGKDYGNNHDLKGFDEYLEFSLNWLTEAHRVLKPTGTIYVFMGVRFISYLYDIMDRVPLDLRDEEIREEYLKNHIKWFLQHHNGSVDKFKESVDKIYGQRSNTFKRKTSQSSLFDLKAENA